MNEAWFFVGLFAFILLVWIALGGPTRGIPLTFPAVSYSSFSTSGTVATSSGSGSIWRTVALPQAPGLGTSYISLPSVSGGSGSGSGSGGETNPLISVPGVSLPTASPYRGRVSLAGSVSNASSTDPNQEYVELSVANDGGPPVDITGWRLVSGATYKSAVIPHGTAVPASGVVNPTSDIVLNPGARAYLVSGISPIGGSFRENKCTGYFGSVQPFTPSLANQCPSAENELYTYYGKPYIHDPSCISYAKSLGTCRLPTAAGEKNLNLTCQDFLDTYLNYNGCLAAHGSDEDFAGTTWHVYLGRAALTDLSHNASYNERQANGPLWRSQYEVVELLDASGRTVDAFTY